jgi:hypothetical protein
MKAKAMDRILGEIEHALKVHLYYLAIAMTLTLPDICAALEAVNGASNDARYKAWYTANLEPLYPWLTADDCWKLRCGVIHQGRFGHPNMQYGRVIFLLPGQNVGMFINNKINDAYFTDLQKFCLDATQRARAWFAAKQVDPIVQSNLENLMQIRPNGLPPYIVGAGVIA